MLVLSERGTPGTWFGAVRGGGLLSCLFSLLLLLLSLFVSGVIECGCCLCFFVVHIEGRGFDAGPAEEK